MVTISIETIGAERMVRGFNRYAEMVKDWGPAFAEIEKNVFAWNKKNFDAQGKPEAFAPLSDRYRMWKERVFPGRPILVLTGKLREALTEGKEGYLRDVKPMEATFGVGDGVKYGEYQYYKGRKAIQLTEGMKSSGEDGLLGMTQILQRYAYQYWRASMEHPA